MKLSKGRFLIVMVKLNAFSRTERLVGHMGNGKYPTVGSSGEYWSINESLNQGFVEMKS